MKKLSTLAKTYIIFWLLSFYFEVLVWLPEWKPHFLKMAVINMSSYVALFTVTHFLSKKLAAKLYVANGQKSIYKYTTFWGIIAAPFLYVLLAWHSDKYIMNFDMKEMSQIYVTRNLKMALLYIIIPIFLSGLWRYKNQIIQGLKIAKAVAEQEKAFAEERKAIANQERIIAEKLANDLMLLDKKFDEIHGDELAQKPCAPSYMHIVRDEKPMMDEEE
jgi:uncharacterized coiled-coil protein SlyX